MAAAAALATGLGEHSASDALIPVLAVNQNSVPKPVADYLADAGERYGDITLYPLGGDARLTPQVISRAVAAAEGDDPADDDATDGLADDAAVDTRDLAERLVASGLTVGESDGTGVAVGSGVVIENGFIALAPPDGRVPSAVVPHDSGYLVADDALLYEQWLVSPGVLDPYLWQPEIPVLEANIDHDGDGELSADERYPLGSPERAEYMLASGGQAPPGATVLVTPDVVTQSGHADRTTAQRYPLGIPVPPGASNRLATTFEERQQQRAVRFARHVGDEYRGGWNYRYSKICRSTPEGGSGNAGSSLVPQKSVDGITCETAADWYLWMCDTMNSPPVAALSPVDAWLETLSRFQAQWQAQIAGDLFEPWLEDTRLIGPWFLELSLLNDPVCVFNDDPANRTAPANVAAYHAAVREIVEWAVDPSTHINFSVNGGRPAADSGYWDGGAALFDALVSIANDAPRIANNNACFSDVRHCFAPLSLGRIWGLRALE